MNRYRGTRHQGADQSGLDSRNQIRRLSPHCSPRDGGRVRLLTRNGHNWADRYPWIVESALKNRNRHFVIDGEAVVLGVDGIADFNALYSRRHDGEAQLYAFDILALDRDDLRKLRCP